MAKSKAEQTSKRKTTRTAIMQVRDLAAELLETIEDARARGDNVKITQRADGGIEVEIMSQTTKPTRPHASPYTGVLDPALIAEWTRLCMRAVILRNRLKADGSLLNQRGYVTAAMVAVAMGRTRRLVDLWAASGKFNWAHKIGNERLWAVDDLDRLIREGQFFKQSVFDRGHAGELATLVEAALEEMQPQTSEPEEPTKKPAKSGQKETRV